MTWKDQLLFICEASSIVTDQQIYSILPAEYHLKFEELMRGKTCPIDENGNKCVYGWDLKQILERL